MERFSVGDIVLVHFPFSDLKGQKLRPAVVLAKVEFENLILCQITSKPYSSQTAIRLDPSDFSTGQLPIVSYIRPDKLFTADRSLIAKSVGKLQTLFLKKLLKRVGELFTLFENNIIHNQKEAKCHIPKRNRVNKQFRPTQHKARKIS